MWRSEDNVCSHLSLSAFLWVPGIKLRLACFLSKRFYCLTSCQSSVQFIKALLQSLTLPVLHHAFGGDTKGKALTTQTNQRCTVHLSSQLPAPIFAFKSGYHKEQRKTFFMLRFSADTDLVWLTKVWAWEPSTSVVSHHAVLQKHQGIFLPCHPPSLGLGPRNQHIFFFWAVLCSSKCKTENNHTAK